MPDVSGLNGATDSGPLGRSPFALRFLRSELRMFTCIPYKESRCIRRGVTITGGGRRTKETHPGERRRRR